MGFSERTKIMLLVIVAIVFLYIVNYYNNNSSSEPIHNDGSLTYDVSNGQVGQNDEDSQSSNYESSCPSSMSMSEDPVLARRFSTRDGAKNGYKSASFKQGKRGGASANLSDFFEEGNPINVNTQGDFSGRDETGGNLASYVPGKKQKSCVEDKFNADELLPQNSTASDVFEDVQATSIKNPHMINIARPYGVDTVSSSLKNASRDVRGNVTNPRRIVSPWNNSSIEPDLNLRGLC